MGLSNRWHAYARSACERIIRKLRVNLQGCLGAYVYAYMQVAVLQINAIMEEVAVGGEDFHTVIYCIGW